MYARFFYRLPNLPRCTQRSASSQISPRQCSFLAPSSLFFGPLTIATSYEFTWSAWSAIKWPTRETDVLVEIASINFFAVVNDLKRWCKKVECIYKPNAWCTSKIQLLLAFARYIIDLFHYIYFTECDNAGIERVTSMMTFKRDNRKGDSANLSQVGRNISDIFNARLSSWWHVLYTSILDI